MTQPTGQPQRIRHNNSRRDCSRAELLADAVVHLLGLGFGLAACISLAVFIALKPDLPRGLSLGLYGFGLLAMLGCSALYNLTSHAYWRALFRRFDHAAIFVMIAGTYTPFSLIVIGGVWGALLLGFVWSVALAGVFLKLRYPLRFEKLSVVAYLALGWVVLAALQPLISSASLAALVLLLTGGGLYSLGVVFHLWERLPYQNAIWHVFVLAAAACHYAAILVDVALA
jgi:hemolysin III